eukprot:366217-Chlamydomonas_euryale.AAC.16
MLPRPPPTPMLQQPRSTLNQAPLPWCRSSTLHSAGTHTVVASDVGLGCRRSWLGRAGAPCLGRAGATSQGHIPGQRTASLDQAGEGVHHLQRHAKAGLAGQGSAAGSTARGRSPNERPARPVRSERSRPAAAAKLVLVS